MKKIRTKNKNMDTIRRVVDMVKPYKKNYNNYFNNCSFNRYIRTYKTLSYESCNR